MYATTLIVAEGVADSFLVQSDNNNTLRKNPNNNVVQDSTKSKYDMNLLQDMDFWERK